MKLRRRRLECLRVSEGAASLHSRARRRARETWDGDVARHAVKIAPRQERQFLSILNDHRSELAIARQWHLVRNEHLHLEPIKRRGSRYELVELPMRIDGRVRVRRMRSD